MTYQTEKAYKTGDPWPALKKDRLRLYSMRTCPFAQRTRLVLAHKAIPWEVVNVHLRRKPEWLYDKNPLGLVPILECNDLIVWDSLISGNYLDAAYPQNKLNPDDPYERARMEMWMERFSKVLAPYWNLENGNNLDESVKELHKQLAVFEESLTGKFFGGEKLSMLDFHMWPWFERFAPLSTFRDIVLLPAASFPRLSAWMNTMKAVPAVTKTALDPDQWREMLRLKYVEHSIDYYDVGL